MTRPDKAPSVVVRENGVKEIKTIQSFKKQLQLSLNVNENVITVGLYTEIELKTSKLGLSTV